MSDKELILELKKRDIGTKGDLHKFRKQGFIPGVLYGGEKETLSILLNAISFIKAIHTEMGEHTIFSLHIDGKKTNQSAMLKDKQIDPISRNIIHIDLQRISMKEKIEISVEVKLDGLAAGVEHGGVVEIVSHDLRISCLPKDIPKNITIDISSLDIGDSIYVKNIVVPSGVTLLDNPDNLVVHIVAPTKLEEKPEEEVVAAAPEEPEIIGKGKKEEEAVAEEEGKEEKEKKK